MENNQTTPQEKINKGGDRFNPDEFQAGDTETGGNIVAGKDQQSQQAKATQADVPAKTQGDKFENTTDKVTKH